MASLAVRRYASSVANPANQQTQRRMAAVSSYRQALRLMNDLRRGTGDFRYLTPAQRDAAISRLIGIPTPAERRRIEQADAAQKAERPGCDRRPSQAAAFQRAYQNRPTNVVADRRTDYIDSREFCGV